LDQSRSIPSRIEESKRLGIDLLWSKVKPDNAASIGLLRRVGFHPWGRFAKVGSDGQAVGSATLFFFLALSPAVGCDAVMSEITRGRVRLDS